MKPNREPPRPGRFERRRGHNLRLPSQHLRIRSDAGGSRKGGAEQRHPRQHLRGDRRGRAPGAPGDPPRPPRQPACPHHRHRLRRPDGEGNLRRHGRGRRRARQRGEAEKRLLPIAARFRRLGGRKAARQRHHERAGHSTADGQAYRRSRTRLHPGAERLRSPLYLLHHPLWPRQFPLGADGCGGRPGTQARRGRLQRDRAHRRRCDQLRRRSAGNADARTAGKDAV